MARIDDLFPGYDFNEVHRTHIAGGPTETLAAAKAATPGEMPLVRALFTLRSLPALVTRGRGMPTAKSLPLAEQMIDFGFLLLAESDDEIVFGFLGQPWKLSGGSMPRLGSADEWRAFDAPGYVKAVINFRAGEGMLETETRVKATDARSRRRFAPYWRLIRPWSGLIRRSWLRAAKRRAERASAPAGPGSGPRR